MTQVKMVHCNPCAFAQPLPASGVSVRHYREGDQSELLRLYGLAKLGVEDAAMLDRKVFSHPSFAADRLFMVEKDGTAVGTAAALVDYADRTQGILHMVAVDPRARRQGIGRLLVQTSLARHCRDGLRRQWLWTDEGRLDAIKLYLGLGYLPAQTSDLDNDRWKRLYERLGKQPGSPLLML